MEFRKGDLVIMIKGHEYSYQSKNNEIGMVDRVDERDDLPFLVKWHKKDHGFWYHSKHIRHAANTNQAATFLLNQY